MSVDSLKVVIEIHGNIFAANVYISLNSEFGSLSVNVWENKIRVNLGVVGFNYWLTLHTSDNLFMPTSFYSQRGDLFKFKKCQDNVQASYRWYVHHSPAFRLQLNPSSKLLLDQSTKSFTDINHQLINSERKIVCSSCSQALVDNPVSFSKISNLPFDLTELYENLFCHKESPNKVLEIVTQPANEMFVTSTCYVLSCINKELLYKDLVLDVLKCKNCHSVICNTKRKNLDRLKDSIFCFKDKIKFVNLENPKIDKKKKIRNKNSGKYTKKENPKIHKKCEEDLGIAISSLINIINDTLETSIMCKLYLEAKVPVSEDNCLLLWVVDPKMKRFVFEKKLDNNFTNSETSIEFVSVIKVLYLMTNSASDVARSWLHDFSVDFHYISDKMLYNIVNHFKESSVNMPRIAGYPRDFSIGYLPLNC